MTETRLEKAQRLVDEYRVHIQTTSEYGTRAYVFGDPVPYLTILYPDGRYYCECEWGQIHSYTDNFCAHALAVKLAAERRNES